MGVKTWANEENCTFLLRKMPRKVWERFKMICEKDGVYPIDRLVEVIKDYVKVTEKTMEV